MGEGGCCCCRVITITITKEEGWVGLGWIGLGLRNLNLEISMALDTGRA